VVEVSAVQVVVARQGLPQGVVVGLPVGEHEAVEGGGQWVGDLEIREVAWAGELAASGLQKPLLLVELAMGQLVGVAVAVAVEVHRQEAFQAPRMGAQRAPGGL
jgi:hypothetical protein